MMEKCLMNRTWLTEYNWVRLRVRLMDVPKLINNGKEIDV